MNAGNAARAVRDIIDLLDKSGFITDTGDFDDAKFNDIGKDLALVGGIEAILRKYGVTIAPKIDKVFQILPLLSGLL